MISISKLSVIKSMKFSVTNENEKIVKETKFAILPITVHGVRKERCIYDS
jgi:hypothetical protein